MSRRLSVDSSAATSARQRGQNIPVFREDHVGWDRSGDRFPRIERRRLAEEGESEQGVIARGLREGQARLDGDDDLVCNPRLPGSEVSVDWS
jgi:hypothetical protein